MVASILREFTFFGGSSKFGSDAFAAPSATLMLDCASTAGQCNVCTYVVRVSDRYVGEPEGSIVHTDGEPRMRELTAEFGFCPL